MVAATLWNRRLQHYPDTRPRMVQLAIVVVATIVLYYEAYVASAVAPSIIAFYGMSFPYYVYITVVANAVGAFASLLAGLADRWGRANLVTYGLGVTGLLVAFGLPNASTAFTFGLLSAVVGFVEGIILVATPALVRDYSPQIGRASAMGFWTLGPVVGSLIVAAVSSSTVDALPDWQSQFVICGVVGLVVFVIALVGLRELSPNLRDQLMVSMQDRALIEARAAGVDTDPRHPWRQVLHLDVIGSAFAVAVFLIIYYTAVGFFTIYFTTIFGMGLAEANGIGNWFWAFDAIALIVVGIVSDRLGVRKPFMLVGAVASVIMTIVFLTRGPDTSYPALVVITSLTAVSLGVAYAPWMASFTETVERRNPALMATGLAVWGWIVRVVVAVSIFILPLVVSSMTPLVQYGAEVKALSTQYAPELQTIAAVDPATLAALPTTPSLAATAVGQIAQKLDVDAATATARLQAVAAVPAKDLAFLQQHGKEVASAAEESASQWRTWWWVCVAGELLFIPFVFVMSGRWSPKRARQDVAEHEQRVAAELERLSRTPTG
ncbi:MAG: MFS transporter [Pseudonocardia sp.]|uniref:MFS transporter n=1 Tax=Pseudonocardia sp. TaxID=60912 RepID=UPI001ACE3FCA|nr:MFS transporter [Pseudonocardia sp.]MBN9096614.1 MFS transporter [Pseudonocardia sp.]